MPIKGAAINVPAGNPHDTPAERVAYLGQRQVSLFAQLPPPPKPRDFCLPTTNKLHFPKSTSSQSKSRPFSLD